MDDALKTRGIVYLNVEAWLLFAPTPSKFLAARLRPARAFAIAENVATVRLRMNN